MSMGTWLVETLDAGGSVSGKAASSSKTTNAVWTTVWPLWKIAEEGDTSVPLVWLRHERAWPEKIEAYVNQTRVFEKTREKAEMVAAAKASDPKPVDDEIAFSVRGHRVVIKIEITTPGSARMQRWGIQAAAQEIKYSLRLDDSLPEKIDMKGLESPTPARSPPIHELARVTGFRRISGKTSDYEWSPNQVDVVQYKLETGASTGEKVADDAPNVTWVRFNDFFDLHDQIKTCFSRKDGGELPQPPPKTWSSSASTKSDEFMKERARLLHVYVREMLNLPRAERIPYLMLFVGLLPAEDALKGVDFNRTTSQAPEPAEVDDEEFL